MPFMTEENNSRQRNKVKQELGVFRKEVRKMNYHWNVSHDKQLKDINAENNKNSGKIGFIKQAKCFGNDDTVTEKNISY